MSKLSRYLFLLIIPVTVFGMLGCGSVSNATPPSGTYQVATVSDLHFNPLYDTNLYSQLTTSPYMGWDTIFKNSTVVTASAPGTDTNYPLLTYTLKSLQQNLGNSPVVLFTGDLLGHNIPLNYCTQYLKANNTPVNPTNLAGCETTQSSNIQAFVDATFQFVATEIRSYLSNVPVLYVPGNIDTYTGSAGPNSTFLVDNAPVVYSQFLTSAFDQQTFTNSFTTGGYYSVTPPGSKLLVIGLNSNSFATGQPTGPGTAEITWLDTQLSAAKAAGQKVWILMHVPPGANSQYIAQVAATPADVDASDASMMWDSGMQSSFMQTLGKYPGLVNMMLAGHTHMDEFRILPTGDVLEQLPGISPCFGNNPAYKVFTVTQNTFTPTDYQAFDYNLAVLPPPAAFGPLYQFSTTYAAESTLRNSLQRLYPQFTSSERNRDTYTLLYGSGTESVNPTTSAPWNPINDVNWPIFACTIGQANQSQYVGCVNNY